ncbi:MAG: hypothetical protein QM656_03395 [Paracoccaceae bacterium]
MSERLTIHLRKLQRGYAAHFNDEMRHSPFDTGDEYAAVTPEDLRDVVRAEALRRVDAALDRLIAFKDSDEVRSK